VFGENLCESERYEVTVTVTTEKEIETGPIYRVPNE